MSCCGRSSRTRQSKYNVDNREQSQTTLQQHTPSKVNILSYNVFMRPFVKTNHSDYKDARLEVFINEYLQNYDIICLQELFSMASSRTKKLIKEGKERGYAYSATLEGSWKTLKPIDSGLVLLSKYPIFERDSIVFTKGSDIDGWSTKGVLSAVIDIPTGPSSAPLPILVLTTHLQAEYDVKNPSYLEIQLDQLRETREFLKKKHTQYPTCPIILCGDFNINARSKPDASSLDASDSYKQMLELLNIGEGRILQELVSESLQYHPSTFGDAVIDESTGKLVPKDVILTHPTCITERSRLDYIFYYQVANAADKSLVVSEAKVEPFYVTGYRFTQLSDHYGVSASFSIQEDAVKEITE